MKGYGKVIAPFVFVISRMDGVGYVPWQKGDTNNVSHDAKGQRDMADQNFDYMFKLLIIGNSSVGKTSFLFRYADNSFTSAFVSTVGIDFKVKTVFRQDKRVKLQIWVSWNTVFWYFSE